MPQDFDCPTGECGAEPDCRSVSVGDPIDPSSTLHTERNLCNRCPSAPPVPVYYDKPGRLWGTRRVLLHWTDSEGNLWEIDNAVTAWWFHDDPFPGFRDNGNMTFRVSMVAAGGKGGWQCRYQNSARDDTSSAMGTYDYAPAGTANHVSMDVTPHNANSAYVGGLTEQY